MKKIDFNTSAYKYFSILLFLVSIVFVYFSVSLRKQDWVTGGLLLSIYTPLLILELILVICFLISQKRLYKTVLIIVEFVITIVIVCSYLVYYIKYN